MKITRKDWEKYIKKLASIDKSAALLIEDYISRFGFNDMQSLINYSASIVHVYGDAAAALSAEMYDEIARAEKKYFPPAQPAEAASYGEIAKTINGIHKTTENPNEYGSAVGRLVKRQGADTTLQNALRDGAEFAWVPSGDTCAFCIALASRGWQRMSKKALDGGHAEHIHSNCDCTYAIRFDGKSTIEGYDPEEYRRQYYGAEGDTPQERINYMRRQQYATDKVFINEQKRTAYAKRRMLLEAESPFKHPKTPLTIYSYNQSKHIVGGEKYVEYMKTHKYPPSYLTITEKEAQELIEKYHGTGILKLDKNGNVIQSEMIIDNDLVIGYAVDNRTGKQVEATGFKIHYSDKGAHIVPMYKSQTEYWRERRKRYGHDWLLRQKS